MAPWVRYIRHVSIKRYSNKEPLVFIWIIIPYILFMNLLIFGRCAYADLPTMLKTLAISAVYFFLIYGVFGFAAVLVKNRYKAPGELFRRISLMLPMFYVLNIGAVHGVFLLYDRLGWVHCPVRTHLVWWTILYACIMSTAITFINEGMANWEEWKQSLAENEKLQNAYQRSKLLGLKGQINPHFLFNCFNTLSGLIHENEQAAERFLDEMIKVHRYLLRGDDEYLVALRDEVRFAESYLHLIKARFGEAIQVQIDVPPSLLKRYIPPLSLQVILEHIIYTNAVSKRQPLLIRISANTPHELIIAHTRHDKTLLRQLDVDEGMDNLITKYKLLGTAPVVITEHPELREIRLPLFDQHIPVA